MLFQQELWLIIVGLVTAMIYLKTTHSQASFKRAALWSVLFSLVVGEIGMLTTLFFPSDLLGLIVTTLAAMIGVRFGIKRSGNTISATRRSSRSSKAKK